MKKEVEVIFGKKCLEEYVEKAAQISEKCFKTKEEPAQMKSDFCLYKKIIKTYPDFFSVLLVNHSVVGSHIMLPCSFNLMDSFLSGRIDEAKLAKEILKKRLKNFDCVFIAEISIDSRFRRKGLGAFIATKSIERILCLQKSYPPFFFWAWSNKGKAFYSELLNKMEIKYSYR